MAVLGSTARGGWLLSSFTTTVTSSDALTFFVSVTVSLNLGEEVSTVAVNLWGYLAAEPSGSSLPNSLSSEIEPEGLQRNRGERDKINQSTYL